MKAHLFSKMSQGLLLLSALLATSCKESSNNFFVPDHEAPSLVSVTPANGETAEENNTILLTFNEYVKAGEGKANFNGEEVELTFKGKTASYAYTALDYNQVCQFSLPKGAVIDFQGNVFEGVSIQFTIRERPQPEARIFDAVVSPDGKGNYTSIQKAIDNVPSKRTEPWLIFVANGTYEEQIIIPEDKPYIHLIGQDVDKTIVKLRINSSTEASATDPDVWKYSYKNLGKTEAAMVSVKATDFYAENISFVTDMAKNYRKALWHWQCIPRMTATHSIIANSSRTKTPGRPGLNRITADCMHRIAGLKEPLITSMETGIAFSNIAPFII